ncbi:dipeptidase [Halobacillus litoralis]|uniref:dipeptidase n=1 Tax=Halobacillus litoralis TaxID=45668 RepID=UPI001CD75FC6|nr:dipeptidase [Halobacillus litoralis]MCA1022747.1 dipeptidase [Halobacillus litoralis]
MLRFIDGHHDTLLELQDGADAFFTGLPSAHLDFPRGTKAGYAAGFFAVFSPNPESDPAPSLLPATAGYMKTLPPKLSREYALASTMRSMARFLQLEGLSGGAFKVIRTITDLKKAVEGRWMGGILHMEGAEALDKDLDLLYVLYHAGVRSIGPVWSRPNSFGEGVPYGYPSSPDTGPGLTPEGRDLIRKCCELGIMIDLSHLNEKGFWDVAALSDKPLVATHANVHRICPVSRNLTDPQIDQIGRSGGLIGITYSIDPNMVTPKAEGDPEASLEDIAEHIDYVKDRIGVEHVALGSDFDGTVVPDAVKDVTGVPALLNVLEKRGWTKGELEQLTYKNWIRVLDQTWRS